MKKIFIPIAFIYIMLFGLNAQNVLTEDFVFAPVDSLENSGDWFRSGINSQFNIKVVSPGLEYPNYAGSGLGNCSQIANSGNGDVVVRNLSTPITSGAAYLSFMFRIDNLPSTVTEGYCIAFNPNTGGTNLNTNLFVKRLSNTTFNLGVRKEYEHDTAYINTVFTTAKTYLVVLKYSIINGLNNDACSIYVFENGVPATEPNMPMASTASGTDYTGQGSIELVNNYAQDGLKGCDIKIDGIRVGNSWATSVLAPGASSVYDHVTSDIPMQVSPNPFQDETTIKFQIPHQGRVSLKVFDASGALCTDLLHDTLEEGSHEIKWNTAGLPAGIYTCTIQYNGAVVSNKLLRVQ